MMKKTVTAFSLSLCLIALEIFAEGFHMTSDDIIGQLSSRQVFSGFGCDGENISPVLNWDKAPEGTESFAITMYDPDAPTGGGWWHWLIFDLDKKTFTVKQNAGNPALKLAPSGSIQSVTSFGSKGYGGACPPQGDPAHRYVFTVHALNVKTLGIDENSSPALVGFHINQHTLAKASLVAYYGR